MRVDRRGAVEHRLEVLPPDRQRDRKPIDDHSE
jgi:hypothetical protein